MDSKGASDSLESILLDHGVPSTPEMLAALVDFVAQHHRLLSAETAHEAPRSDPNYSTYIVMVLICLVCAALASGLTQGLLSLDYMEMKIRSESGTDVEQSNAAKVLPIIERHHLLLVTLMLWNATAMEALPIFLNNLVPEWLAIVLSVTLILFVGEIVPAAILTGPKQLAIAAACAPLVYVVLFLFFPIAYPISLALDQLLGKEEGITQYNRREMATLVRLQHEEVSRGGGGDNDDMHMDEVAIIEGALTFRNIQVREVMTPLSEVFMLSARDVLSYKTLSEIFKSGYSRIPVYEANKDDIIGLILVKDLLFVDPEDATPLKNFVQLFGRQPTLVWQDDTLGLALAGFRQKQSHMALVRDVVDNGAADATYRMLGIVTLEDIIETILGAEIEDETDTGRELDKKSEVRDFDFARLKLLNSKISDDIRLGEDEVKAVAAHLLSNVLQVQQLFEMDMEAVRELVRRSTVVELRRKSDNALKPAHEDLLYRKGIPSTYCTLILNGKITVITGRDEFRIDVGAWSILAPDCLIVPEGQYQPDFVAYISSDTVRVVRLSIYAETHSSDSDFPLPFAALEKRKGELGLSSQRRAPPTKRGAGLAVGGGVSMAGGGSGGVSSLAKQRHSSPVPVRGLGGGAAAGMAAGSGGGGWTGTEKGQSWQPVDQKDDDFIL